MSVNNPREKFTRADSTDSRVVEAQLGVLRGIQDLVNRMLGRGTVTREVLQKMKSNPNDLGDVSRNLMKEFAADPRNDPILRRVISPMVGTTDQDMQGAMRRLPQILEPGQNGILHRLFPNLKLFDGALKVPANGVVIQEYDAAGKVIASRPANLTMGELIQVAERNPEWIKGPRPIYALDQNGGRADFQKSMDEFARTASSRYRDQAGRRAAIAVIRASKVIGIIGAIVVGKTLVDNFSPRNPVKVPGKQEQLDRSMDFLNVPDTTDQNEIFKSNSGYGGTGAADGSGYGAGLGKLGTPKLNQENNPAWMHTDFGWLKESFSDDDRRISVSQVSANLKDMQVPDLPDAEGMIDYLQRAIAANGGNVDVAFEQAFKQMQVWAIDASTYIETMMAKNPGLEFPEMRQESQ